MAFPSTFQDIQNAVIAKLRLDATNDLAKVKDWINQIYADVCVETEANQAVTTLALVAGTANSTVASTILRIKQMYVTPVGGTQSAPLIETNLDEILRRRQASAPAGTGSVTHYALLPLSRIEWYPTPASADTVTIYYVGLPTALSANGDVPILQEPYASKLLEYGALAEGADYKNDPSEMTYRSLYEDWKRRYRGHLRRRAGAQTQQFDIVGAGTFPPHDPSSDISLPS